MRALNPNNSADRRGITAVLLSMIGVSFLLLWSGTLIHKRVHATSESDAWLSHGKPSGSVARLASGAPTQGPFTLNYVTRTHDRQIPPDLIRPNSGLIIIPTEAAGSGTELWIKDANGLGLQTLALPATAGQFDFHYGSATLRITRQQFQRFPGRTFLSVRTQWLQSDGKTEIDLTHQPYDPIVTWTRNAEGRRRTPHLYLIPRHLTEDISVQAQTMNDAGHPTSLPISLVWQPITQNLLFAQIPSAYSNETKRVAITIFNRHEPNVKAHWTFSDLPTPSRTLDSFTPTKLQTTIGPLTIKASVAEASDTISSVGQIYEQNDLRMPGMLARDPSDSTNLDGHVPTGIPTLRCTMQVQNNATKPGEEWRLATDSITPQWSAMTKDAEHTENSSLGSFASQIFLDASSKATQHVWATQEIRCGVAYPNQQKLAEIVGSATRIGTRTEKLTFHNADVVYNPTAKRWQIVWSAEQSLTSPSGIDVITLNPRADVPTGSENSGAEMWLAWHVPDTLSVDDAHNDQSLEDAHVGQPDLEEPLQAKIDQGNLENSHSLWYSVWLPGATLDVTKNHVYSRLSGTPIFGFIQANYKPLHLWVSQKSSSKTALCPLPRHLKTITVVLKIRYEAENHPFKLVVPVSHQQLLDKQ